MDLIKPWEKSVRSRDGKKRSVIVRLAVWTERVLFRDKVDPAPKSRPDRDTMKVPTHSTHITGQHPVQREPSAPFDVIDDNAPLHAARRCTHTILRGETSCWVCGLLGRMGL